MPVDSNSGIICRSCRISGRVQLVGYRMFAVAAARRLGVTGWVRNCPDGSVDLLAQGPPARVDRLLEILRTGPSAASVEAIRVVAVAPSSDLGDFHLEP